MNIYISLPKNVQSVGNFPIYGKAFYFNFEKNQDGKTVQESHLYKFTPEKLRTVVQQYPHSYNFWTGDQKLSSNVIKHFGLVIDIDKDLKIEQFQEITELKDYHYFLYTSRSHTPDNHKFHVLFPFKVPIQTLEFKEMLKSWGAILEKVGIKNDTTHDSNLSNFFYPSRYSGKPVSKNFIFYENKGTVINKELLDDLQDFLQIDVSRVTEIKNKKNEHFDKDLVDDFKESDVIKASEKIGKMANDLNWNYGKIINIGFSLSDMEKKELIGRETALTALFNISKFKNLSYEMIKNKYENNIVGQERSVSMSTFLEASQKAGYSKHIIKYKASSRVGNKFLVENITTIKKTLLRIAQERVNTANFIQTNSGRETLGTQYTVKNGKLYLLNIEYNEDLGYWIHSHRDIMPVSEKDIINELLKEIDVDASLLPSIRSTFLSFVTSIFPHNPTINLISAMKNEDYTDIWREEYKAEVVAQAKSYIAKNPFYKWEGIDKQKDADLILDLISKVFYKKEDLDFYLNWLTLFCYVDKIGTTPVLIFTSKNRGTGKSMLLVDIPRKLFKKNVATDYKSGDFNSYVRYKLVSLSEVGASQKSFNEAAKIIKKLTGSKNVLLNDKNEKAVMIPSRSFFVIDSNEEVPIRLFDETNAQNNQFYVLRLKDSLTDRYENWESEIMENTILSGRYESMISAFREIYLEPRLGILKKWKNTRFGLKVPITDDLKILLGKSISIKDRVAVIRLFDLYTTRQIGDMLTIKNTTMMIKFPFSEAVLKSELELLTKDNFLSNSLSRIWFEEHDTKLGIQKRLINLDVLTEPIRKRKNGESKRGWTVNYEKLQSLIKSINPTLNS